MNDIALKVLVIDDCGTQLLASRMLLEATGLEVATANVATAAAILDLARVIVREEPNVVLLDVNVGQGNFDGSRLVLALKQATAEPPVVILYSSLGPDRLKELTRRRGADGFLTKGSNMDLPSRLFELLDRLERREAA